MSCMNPIVLITIPIQFEDITKIDDIDLSELGIINKSDVYDFNPDKQTVEPVVIQMDRITGYTPVKTKSGKNYTMIYIDGFKWWCNLSFIEFDKLYKEKVLEFNNLLKEYI